MEGRTLMATREHEGSQSSGAAAKNRFNHRDRIDLKGEEAVVSMVRRKTIEAHFDASHCSARDGRTPGKKF
jgi:hypothetical protein